MEVWIGRSKQFIEIDRNLVHDFWNFFLVVAVITIQIFYALMLRVLHALFSAYHILNDLNAIVKKNNPEKKLSILMFNKENERRQLLPHYHYNLLLLWEEELKVTWENVKKNRLKVIY